MKVDFNINTIFIGLLSIFIGYNIISYYVQSVDIYTPPIGALPAPLQIGKNKLIVSKTGDASMSLESSSSTTVFFCIISSTFFIATFSFTALAA
jgi:hypothetical protein